MSLHWGQNCPINYNHITITINNTIKHNESLAKVIENMDDDIYTKLNLEEHQTKIPGTHMVIAALEHGLGSTWVSYFDVDKLTHFLNLTKPYIASEIIAFGYPVSNENVTDKKGFSEVVFYNKFE